MKGPKLFYLLFAAAVVAVLAWYLHRSERGSWQDRAVPVGTKILGDFPVNDVTAILLSGPGGRATLERGETGWGVAERSGYPADFERVSALVLKMSDLGALQSVPVGAADYGALALRTGAVDIPQQEAGTTVELKNSAGQPVAAVVLGKTHLTTPPGMRPEIGGTASGRYVMPVAGGGNAYLVSETFSDLQTAPSAWVDKTFVRPGTARRIAVQSKEGQWVLTREAAGGPWTMQGLRKNQSLDTAKVTGIDSMFGSMAVADVADGPDDARTKPLGENPVTVTADTFDGVRYVLTIGRGDGDSLPVKVTAEAVPGEPQPATEEAGKAREEKLAAAARFKDRVVFVPRNFVAPFLHKRADLLTGAAGQP